MRKEKTNIKNVQLGAGPVERPDPSKHRSEQTQQPDYEQSKANIHTSENDQSMAESVTRHALISDIDQIEYLTCGIDSLDVSFYVDWDDNWEERKKSFDNYKAKAQEKEEFLVDIEGIRPHLFYPSGKAPNYRYHVKYSEYDCFIAITKSTKHFPNVYVSFTSEALHWELTEKELIELVSMDIEALGGNVIQHKISRCDLYADFRIPSGLSHEFLKSRMVGKADHTSNFMNRDKLETFYVGGKAAPLQLRIYDKSEKIKKDGSQERWLLLWFTDNPENVWRVEFQIRRTVLNQFKINTIDELRKQKADLWKYVTGEWFNLRCLDNQNKSRRTIHYFWEKVQACIYHFGPERGTKRHYERKKARFINWHILRIANLLISCAAILKDHQLESCLEKVTSRLLQAISEKEFKAKARKKSLVLGIDVTNECTPEAKDIFNNIFLNQ